MPITVDKTYVCCESLGLSTLWESLFLPQRTCLIVTLVYYRGTCYVTNNLKKYSIVLYLTELLERNKKESFHFLPIFDIEGAILVVKISTFSLITSAKNVVHKT